MATLTIEQINQKDIVQFLASLGYEPTRISVPHYWYLSMLPGRNERTASFKVNRRLNRWYDFGTGEGSTLVDFGIRYFNCSVRQLVIRLSDPTANLQIVPQQHPRQPDDEKKKLFLIKIYHLRSLYLLHYLTQRRISLVVAQKYCAEVQYCFGTRYYYAIGFRCDAGGYELRNKFHKYSSSPKSPTLIRHGSKDIAVFEGFFDLLTLLTYLDCPAGALPDCLVLNSAAFFTAQLPLLSTYRRKHLFLDNDATGDRHTRTALDLNAGFLDHRPLYKGYKDLNDWACHIGSPTIACLPSLPAKSQNSP